MKNGWLFLSLCNEVISSRGAVQCNARAQHLGARQWQLGGEECETVSRKGGSLCTETESSLCLAEWRLSSASQHQLEEKRRQNKTEPVSWGLWKSIMRGRGDRGWKESQPQYAEIVKKRKKNTKEERARNPLFYYNNSWGRKPVKNLNLTASYLATMNLFMVWLSSVIVDVYLSPSCPPLFFLIQNLFLKTSLSLRYVPHYRMMQLFMGF